MKGYSSMPNDPLGRYKGVLSLAQLERARRCALQNAEELVSDAELLVQHSRWARGFFLAQIAVEELGKYVMIVSATGNIVMGTMDWKKFWKRYRSHKEKLQNIHLMEEVFFEEEPPKILDHLPNEVAEFDALKMRALYSEHFFDRVIKPSDTLQRPGRSTLPRSPAHVRHAAVEPRRQREGRLRATRTRLHNHHPEHLLSRTPRHAGLRRRRDGGSAIVRATLLGLQHGCSKRARESTLALSQPLRI